MIELHFKAYKRSDRDIAALTYVVIAFLITFACRAAFLAYEGEYQNLWPLMPQAIPLLAVLVVVRVAGRLISHGNILREDDRRREVVRTAHHLIAITKDLRARVGYAKAVLTEGGRPPVALVQVAKSIEDRYEALLQRESYQHLPGPCVDIITRISGDIFGIGVLAEGVKQATADKPATMLMPASSDGGRPSSIAFDDIMKDLQELLDRLFELRHSIEVVKGKN